MLWTIVIVLLGIWLLGFVFDLIGGLIHVLLVIAAIVLVVRFIRKISR